MGTQSLTFQNIFSKGLTCVRGPRAASWGLLCAGAACGHVHVLTGPESWFPVRKPANAAQLCVPRPTCFYFFKFYFLAKMHLLF